MCVCVQLDKSKIEVIRWLIFDRGQRSEAIHQGNALMRQFLGKHTHTLCLIDHTHFSHPEAISSRGTVS